MEYISFNGLREVWDVLLTLVSKAVTYPPGREDMEHKTILGLMLSKRIGCHNAMYVLGKLGCRFIMAYPGTIF